VDRSDARRRTVRLGVTGALLAFVALAALGALVIKPFLPADESNNVAYSLSVARGELPRVDAPIRHDLPDQRRMPLNYVANHPPLYYALVSPGLRFAVEADEPRLGMTLARLETTLLSAGAIVLTAVLAGVLTRGRRPEVAVGAAALLATASSYVLHAAIIHNDGLATTLVAGQLVATVLVLVRGLRPLLVLAVVLTASLGLLTRVSAVSLVALSAAALLAAGLLHPHGDRLRGAVRGTLAAVALVLACAATSGWFYLHNLRAYGDVTGGDEVERLLQLNVRPGSIVYHALKPDTMNRLWARMFGLDPFDAGARTALLTGILAAVALGTVLLVARSLRASSRARLVGDEPGPSEPALYRPAPFGTTPYGPAPFGPAPFGPAPDGPEPDGRPAATGRVAMAVVVAVGVLLVLHVLAVLLQVGTHIKDGGGIHPRYLFPALPVLLIGMAAALLAFPGRLGRAVLVGVIAIQAVLTLVVLSGTAARWTGGPRRDALADALELADVPYPTAVLVLLLLCYAAGLVMVAAAIWTAPRPGRPAPRTPDSAQFGEEQRDLAFRGGG
jgi:hypothetical protein